VGAIALTFDDGPDAHWTPLVLDALAEHRAPATFFVIAPLASAQPGLVARILAEGHRIELHCDEHRRHSTQTAAWGAADTGRALARLRALGIQARLWRTPWGDEAPWTRLLAAARGLQVVGWNASTRDWRGDSASFMFGAIQRKLTDGAIVLAHDGMGPGALRSGCEHTISLVHLITAHASDAGHRLVLLDEHGQAR